MSLGKTSVMITVSALGCALAAARADAATCASLNLPNPVYVESGDTQEPLLKNLGRKLRDSQAQPITLLYRTTGSCTLVNDIYTNVKMVQTVSYVPSSAENAAWKASDPSLTCDLDPDPNARPLIDVAISALFVEACDKSAPPKGIKLLRGPVQAYTFVVPQASTEVAITAEEAYFAFGFGQTGRIDPWNDEAQMFIRPTTKSTLLTLAAHIGVAADKWRGARLEKSTEVLNAVAQATNPQKAIGILGAEVYDANRDKLKVLAFRAFKQKYAYFPDSSFNATDKRNLRDGHYLPWSPTVYLTHVDDGGAPTNAKAQYFIDLVLGNKVDPPFESDPLETVISRGLIPDCAMKVTRSFEGGPLSLYTPDAACGCYYDSKTGGTSCDQCTDDSTCNGGKCRHGYCEAK